MTEQTEQQMVGTGSASVTSEAFDFSRCLNYQHKISTELPVLCTDSHEAQRTLRRKLFIKALPCPGNLLATVPFTRGCGLLALRFFKHGEKTYLGPVG